MDPRTALRELRGTMGLSQERLARYLDVSIQTVVRMERDSPKGRWLLALGSLAQQQDRDDLAEAFWDTFAEDFRLHEHGLSLQRNGK